MSVPSVPIPKNLDPESQEDNYVHNIYNEIASHFSQTRYKPWPIVEKFLNDREDYSIGLDVGCGNGKYLGVNKKLFMVGTDRSSGLIKCANEISEGSYNLGVADGLSLPHQEGRFDFAISIAVVHHFATAERRVKAISHILSKIRSGGQVLIYCWALEQEKSRRGYKEGDEQDILIPWVLAKKNPKKNKEQKGRNDGIDHEVKEKREESHSHVEKDQTKFRFYHLYKKGELSDNAIQTGVCTVVDEGYEKDNWWVIVQKN